ncbi:MAG: DNA/RNA non-specific endonuclease [Prevotella sp.]|nr:DNA/RNA non-specific endonuclease [Prevotella sp.]
MKPFRFIPILAFLFALTACGTDVDFNDEEDNRTTMRNNTNRNDTRANSVYGRLEFPKLKGGANNIVIVHRASFGVNYCVEWDTDLHPTGWNEEGSLRSQRWSCYQMHPGNTSNATDRKPRNYNGPFTEYPNDPDLDSQYHFTADPYSGSGYDHGHIIPSADRAYSYNSQANTQTFYMTNMQPQVNGFNGYVWANMEKIVREWNNNNFRDTLYVVKGGTIDDNANIIRYLGSGRNKIPVPKYFFMALLCKNQDPGNGGYKALGFWIQHQSSSTKDLRPYVVNIDELERLTGIDFFCNLPDDIENAVESLDREKVLNAWKVEDFQKKL